MTDDNKKIFASNLMYYLEQRHMTQTDLARELGIPNMTISNWINAKTYPRVDKIQMIADYFNIGKSQLTEMRNDNSKVNEQAYRIAAHIDDDVSEEEMNDILKYIDFIKSQHKD